MRKVFNGNSYKLKISRPHVHLIFVHLDVQKCRLRHALISIRNLRWKSWREQNRAMVQGSVLTLNFKAAIRVNFSRLQFKALPSSAEDYIQM